MELDVVEFHIEGEDLTGFLVVDGAGDGDGVGGVSPLCGAEEDDIDVVVGVIGVVAEFLAGGEAVVLGLEAGACLVGPDLESLAYGLVGWVRGGVGGACPVDHKGDREDFPVEDDVVFSADGALVGLGLCAPGEGEKYSGQGKNNEARYPYHQLLHVCVVWLGGAGRRPIERAQDSRAGEWGWCCFAICDVRRQKPRFLRFFRIGERGREKQGGSRVFCEGRMRGGGVDKGGEFWKRETDNGGVCASFCGGKTKDVGRNG